MNYALIGSPLSLGFRRRLEESLQEAPVYLTLGELRRLPPAALVRKLVTLRADRLLLPLEDSDAYAYLPAALCLAALTTSRSITLVDPDLKMQRVPRWKASMRAAATVSASLSGAASMMLSRRAVASLAVASRLELAPPPVGRVLYLRTNMSFGVRAGGSVGHTAGVINALSRGGYPVDVASIDRPAMLDSEVRVRPLAPLGAYGFPYETNLYRFNDSIIRQALRLVAAERYAFIYQRLSIASYAGAVVSRRARLPLVVEYNGSEAWVANNWAVPFRDRDLAADAERVLLRHAHVVLTVSDVLRDELVDAGVERDRVVVYPNCIDPKVYDPARFTPAELEAIRHRHGISPDAVVAAFVGTFGQWHGVDVLARTIRRMVEAEAARVTRSRLHFLLVGDGLLMSSVRDALRAPEVAARCTLTGLVPQADTPAYVAAADLLLSPHVPNADGTRFFGSPTKLFEYMAMRKPIVASDLEQIGEVLRDSLRADALPPGDPRGDESQLAILCRPGSEEELARAIFFVAEARAWRDTLGANARREVLQRYTWDRHVQALTNRLYRR